MNRWWGDSSTGAAAPPPPKNEGWGFSNGGDGDSRLQDWQSARRGRPPDPRGVGSRQCHPSAHSETTPARVIGPGSLRLIGTLRPQVDGQSGAAQRESLAVTGGATDSPALAGITGTTYVSHDGARCASGPSSASNRGAASA